MKYLFSILIVFTTLFTYAQSGADSINYEQEYWKLKYQQLANSNVTTNTVSVEEVNTVEPVKGVISLGFSTTGTLSWGLPTHFNYYRLIPSFEARFGNRGVRGTVTVGPTMKLGFEVGRYFIFSGKGGYDIFGQGPLVEIEFGGRIPLNKAHTINMAITHGAGLRWGQINGNFGLKNIDINFIKFGFHFNLIKP